MLAIEQEKERKDVIARRKAGQPLARPLVLSSSRCLRVLPTVCEMDCALALFDVAFCLHSPRCLL